MKRTFLLILAMVTVFSFTACKKTNEKSVNLEGSLEEIMDKIYETADLDNDFREYVNNDGLERKEVNTENAEYYLGKSDIEFEEAIAHEPIVRPVPFHWYLFVLKRGRYRRLRLI